MGYVEYSNDFNNIEVKYSVTALVVSTATQRRGVNVRTNKVKSAIAFSPSSERRNQIIEKFQSLVIDGERTTDIEHFFSKIFS